MPACSVAEAAADAGIIFVGDRISLASDETTVTREAVVLAADEVVGAVTVPDGRAKWIVVPADDQVAEVIGVLLGRRTANVHVAGLEDDVGPRDAVLAVSVEAQVGRQPGEREDGVGGDAGHRAVEAAHVGLQAADRSRVAGDSAVEAGQDGLMAADRSRVAGDSTVEAGHVGLQAADRSRVAGDSGVQTVDALPLRGDRLLRCLEAAQQSGDGLGLALDLLLQGGDGLG